MRVIFNGTIEEIKTEIGKFLDELKERVAEDYKAPDVKPLYPEKTREQRKKEDIDELKAAYREARAKKKEEKISEQIAEAQQRMDPEEALTEAAGKKKRGRPKGSSWQQSAENIVKAVDEEGKSFSQIGREMGCSYKTISNIYYRAKENEL